MISREEMNPHGYKLTEEQERNQVKLHKAINEIRAAWGKPMIVTSGVRSGEDQAKINPKAVKSKHLVGAAIDISDQTGALYKWCQENESLLEKNDLYIEAGTVGWVHFQCLPPKSRKRFFLP